MKIVIEIPEEFGRDYETDKFNDFFSRVQSDIENGMLCGNYEKETAEMFLNAFNDSSIVNKNTPKKLKNIRKIKIYDGYDMGNCPACGEPLDNSFYNNLKYCFVCGQAIDFEYEDDY